MSKVGKGELSMSEAWDQHRSGSSSSSGGDGDVLDDVGFDGQEMDALPRQSGHSTRTPGRGDDVAGTKTGTRRELPCGEVVTVEAGGDVEAAVEAHRQDCDGDHTPENDGYKHKTESSANSGGGGS